MTLKIDFLTTRNVYLKQEAARARLALEFACAKSGLSSDDLLEVAGYQESELINEMQKLQREAQDHAEMVIGCKEESIRQITV